MYGFIKKAFTSYIYIYIRQQSYKFFFFLISFFFITNSVFADVTVNTTSTLNSYDNANESGATNGSGNTFNITGGSGAPITITAGTLINTEYHLAAGLSFATVKTSTNGVSGNIFNITYTNFNSTSTTSNYISAGWSVNDTATEENNNKLILNNVNLNKEFTLYGLYTISTDVAKINNNSVTADNLTNDTGKDIWIHGSFIKSGDGEGNFADIKNSTFNRNAEIYGFFTGNTTSDIGDAKNNYVKIDNSKFNYGTTNAGTSSTIYGAYSNKGTGDTNYVNIKGSDFKKDVTISGFYINSNGVANDNYTKIEGTNTFNAIYYTYIYGSDIQNDGEANNNYIKIEGVNNIFSGGSGSFTDIAGSNINSNYYFVSTTDGIANGNYAKIEGINIFNNETYIAGSNMYLKGVATSNYVNIEGTNNTFNDYVYIYGSNIGNDGTATDNSVKIEGTNTFNDYAKIYGSYIENDGDADGNYVEIEGTNTFSDKAFIYGSYTGYDGDANNNYVKIEGVNTFNNDIEIHGSYNGKSSAGNDNYVDIKNATFNAGAIIYGKNTFNGGGISNKNYVNIEDSHFYMANNVSIYGYNSGDYDTTGNFNYVNIKNSDFLTMNISAFRVNKGTAKNNYVNIEYVTSTIDATIYSVLVEGNGTFNGEDNKITIKNSTFNKSTIYGSRVMYYITDAIIKNSSISISDTTFNGETKIYGGFFDIMGNFESTDNIININENVVFKDKAYILGASYGRTPIDIFTDGNTLNLKSKISISDINNFEYLNFYIPTGFVKGATGDILITFDDAYNTDYDLTDVKITLDVSNISFDIGDEVVLMENLTGGIGIINISNATIQDSAGIWQFELIQDTANRLLATVTGFAPPPPPPTPSDSNRYKSFLESQLASSSLVLQGFDEIADTSSFASLKPDANGIVIFSNAKGGKSRYETGSYIDLTGGNVYAGLGYKNKNLVFGAFAEFGAGSYKSHNEIDIIVKADGDLSYYGGGLLARIDFDNNIFFDTTFHIGQTTNTFSSNDIDTSTNSPTKFDTKSLYYGYSASLGYKFEIDEQNRIELFGRYLGHTRQKIKEVAPTIDGVKTGDVVEFDALNSNRVRVGGRYIYNFRNGFNMSFGGDYTIEFDGEQKARTNNKEIEAPTLKGSTASGKIGIGYNSDRFVFDLYGSNYFGVRNGFDGGAKFAYMFGDEPAPIKPVPLLNESFWAMGGIFKINSNQLLPPTKTKVLALSERIKGLKNQDYLILVIGHTDSTGKYAKNKKLSLARAISFRSELVKNGIDEKRIIAMGIADEAPIASNKTAAGREQNRRVEIEVVSKKEWENMDIDSELSKIKNKI